jgi:hypothetical protein
MLSLFFLSSIWSWFLRAQQLVVIGIAGKHYKKSPIPNKLGTMRRHGRPVKTRIVHAENSSSTPSTTSVVTTTTATTTSSSSIGI